MTFTDCALVLWLLVTVAAFIGLLFNMTTIPGPSTDPAQVAFEAALNRPLPRHECECPDCMEPGLRGPDTTSLGGL